MEQDLHFSHEVYKNDPLLFKSYIGMEVDILTVDGDTISGIAYTVDPVSKSVVVVSLPEGRQRTGLKIVFGHTIKSISICSNEPCRRRQIPELFTNAPKDIVRTMLETRKAAAIGILVENRFPVKEQNDILTIEDVLSIKPPYEPTDCISANSIILSRIQNILSRIPTNSTV
ncbi:gem-associated protein 6-like [Ceratina calcarata]|uniref:Gem-associated protein 6-like n=1 Tax=Ceratina calcarata TaxID=156304 RepID=A0AAJ7J565_9HYME|nr:gem-associated protein 6-like [Ceratina calcarata]